VHLGRIVGIAQTVQADDRVDDRWVDRADAVAVLKMLKQPGPGTLESHRSQPGKRGQMESERPYPVDSFLLRRLDLPQPPFYFPRSKQLENAVQHQEGVGPAEPAFGGRVRPLRCLRRLQEQLPNMER